MAKSSSVSHNVATGAQLAPAFVITHSQEGQLDYPSQ